MRAGKPKVWRVLGAFSFVENRHHKVELEAPQRVLVTPTLGLEQHVTLRGSATRG